MLKNSFRDVLQISRNGRFDCLSVLKAFLSDDCFEFGVKEKSHQVQDQVNIFVVPVRRYFLQTGTAGCSAHTVSLLFKHEQIFGDNLTNFVIFHVSMTYDHRNSQLTFATHHLAYMIDAGVSQAYWRPPAFGIICHLLILLTEPFVPHKSICAPHSVVPYICWTISRVCDGPFLNRIVNNFRFIRSYVFIVERFDKEMV